MSTSRLPDRPVAGNRSLQRLARPTKPSEKRGIGHIRIAREEERGFVARDGHTVVRELEGESTIGKLERAFVNRERVMRGYTRRSLPHMRFLHGCHAGIARELHPISVRTELVRWRCYYILWLKASNVQDMLNRSRDDRF